MDACEGGRAMGTLVSRRMFLRSVMLGAGALAIAACGTTPQASGPATAQSGTGSTPLDVTYWGSFSGALGKAEQSMVDSFNASQQDVHVTLQQHASYEETAQKLTAALQAKTAPDIALLSDVWWFKFYTARALAPLTALLQAEKVDLS